MIETSSLATTAGWPMVAGRSSPKLAPMSSLVLVTRVTTRTSPARVDKTSNGWHGIDPADGVGDPVDAHHGGDWVAYRRPPRPRAGAAGGRPSVGNR